MVRSFLFAALAVVSSHASAFDCSLSVAGRSGGETQQGPAEASAMQHARDIFASECSRARCSCGTPEVRITHSAPSPVSEAHHAFAVASGEATGCEVATDECPE